MDDRKVTRIEPLDKLPGMQKVVLHKKVAAYVRVSTGREEQLNSFEAQRDYYEKYIKSNSNWEFVDIYSDEGISGVSTKDRKGFNAMVQDALNGKIDLILTKSLSRFARNTVDTLKTLRALKEKNIEVYFEKEDIRTLDAKGELLITLMSSLAQEESRSLSENVTWGKRKRFADGKYDIIYNNFLGYKAGKNGAPEIDEDEAPIVRYMFLRFLEGWTAGDIARKLENAEINTLRGKTHWRSSTIKSILANEKYYGAALLQKSYTTDYLTKKMVKNNGVLPQYLVENGHPAIISKEQYDEVQKKLNFETRPVSKTTCFNEQVTCESCGTIYGRRKWTRPDGIFTWVWECPQKYKEPKCCSPHIYEEFMQDAYYKAVMYLFETYKRKVLEYLKKLESVLETTMLLKEFELFLQEKAKEKLIDKNLWLIMTKKVFVTSERKLRFEFISGEIFTHTIPDRVERKIGIKRPTEKEIKTIPITRNYERGHRLTEEDKQIISFYTRQGLGYRRISKLTGFSMEALKSLLSRHREDPFYYPSKGYCLQCGAQVTQTPHKKERKFCSDECRMKWWSVHQIEINKKAMYPFTCKQCGKDFEAYGQNHRVYCSRECYAEAQRSKALKNTKTKDSNVYTLTCAYCGREFKSLGVPDKKYCSRPCEKSDTKKQTSDFGPTSKS